MRDYWVYIMTNRSGTLYVGVTNDLARRIAEHKAGSTPGFTARYALDRLIYCEAYPTARDAIAREKQLKGWRRARKVALINATNPRWRDLAADLDAGTLPPLSAPPPSSSAPPLSSPSPPLSSS